MIQCLEILSFCPLNGFSSCSLWQVMCVHVYRPHPHGVCSAHPDPLRRVFVSYYADELHKPFREESLGMTFMFTFTTAGTFAYHCNIHPYMKATITVTS